MLTLCRVTQLICLRARAPCAAPALRASLACHLPQSPSFAPALRPLACSADDAANTSGSAPSKPVPKTWNVRPVTKDDVEFSFARSGGAGGQNVNKVSTKVDMRIDLNKATWIPHEIREQMKAAEKNRINNEGALVVTSQKHRTQAQNMEDALAKIQGMIDDAVRALTPTIADEETVKRVKANIKAGNERRIQNKKMDARKKQERSRKNWD